MTDISYFINFWRGVQKGTHNLGRTEIDHTVWFLEGLSAVNANSWVKCEDRLPEEDTTVYIWPRPDFGVPVYTGQYLKYSKKGCGWYTEIYDSQNGIETLKIQVTHWMPIPTAPNR